MRLRESKIEKDARIDKRDMVGDARVSDHREHPQHATCTCHFDVRGRVKDSSYHIYRTKRCLTRCSVPERAQGRVSPQRC